MVGFEDGRSFPVGDGFSVDRIAVIVIQDKYISIAFAGWDKEWACQVGVNASCLGVPDGGEALVSGFAIVVVSWEHVIMKFFFGCI